jgi:ribosomal protein S18 acetylase RimI-like enzyme
LESDTKTAVRRMKIALQEDPHPDIDFYYQNQFKIYHEPYLIWDRDIWETVLATSGVYRIEVDAEYVGDVLLENRGKVTKSIVDFSLLPEYQGKGIGKAALELVKEKGIRLTAVTRKETISFFLKSGFVIKKRIKNYYAPNVDGYFIGFSQKAKRRKLTRIL